MNRIKTDMVLAIALAAVGGVQGELLGLVSRDGDGDGAAAPPPPEAGPVTTSGGVPTPPILNPSFKGASPEVGGESVPSPSEFKNADGKSFASHQSEKELENLRIENEFKQKLIEQGCLYPGGYDARPMVQHLALVGPVKAVRDLVDALRSAADYAHKRGQPITGGKLQAQAKELEPMVFRMAELETLGR